MQALEEYRSRVLHSSAADRVLDIERGRLTDRASQA
jgi:hypothetical protein